MLEQPSTLPRPLAYSIKDFVRETTLSRGTVYNMIKDGRLRVVKIGARTLIPASEIDRLLSVEGQ